MKEAIEIRKQWDTNINCDEGQYNLTHVFDELLEKISPRSRKQTGKSSRTWPNLGSLPVSLISVDKGNSGSQNIQKVMFWISRYSRYLPLAETFQVSQRA